jgi:hypothetical protein
VIDAEEKVKQIQSNIPAAQSRQKSYADKRRIPLKFKVGDCYRHNLARLEGGPQA